MEHNESFLKKIVGMGTLHYPLQKIINILDIEEKDIEAFQRAFDDTGSAVYKAYQKGIDKAEYAIDTKLFEMAQKGDLDALEKYEERMSYNRLIEKTRKEKTNDPQTNFRKALH